MKLPEFQIGRYLFPGIDVTVLMLPTEWSDPDDSIKSESYDHMLHQSLDKIFRERCLGSSEKFKEFLRGSQHNTDYNSIIEPILEQEPFLNRLFTKEEMRKLSLLWIAVLCCYEKSAELLVRCGADVNEPFGRHDPQVIRDKWTVLYVLFQMHPSPENEQLIRLIVDHGADLEARDLCGFTVLYSAMKAVRIQLAEFLLERGADVNVVDFLGWTPLLFAAACGAKANITNELVPLLMRHGANVLFKSKHGANVLHLLASASENSEEDIVDLARVFIEKGVSLDDERVRDHWQPIHAAAKAGNNKLVKLYLDHGANVNAQTETGESPLSLAIQHCDNNSLRVVKTLLKRGANVHMRTKTGHTALHAAFISKLGQRSPPAPQDSENNKREIIRLLLSAGADVLAEDNDGKTALAIISRFDFHELAGKEAWPLIEALALRKALQPSIELKDETIIERNPNFQYYYEKCTEEIDRMKSASFIETCTCFQLLAKCRCQIAELMRNPDFETKFKLYDLNDEFPICAENLILAFERAHEYYRKVQEMEYMINEVVYEILPYMIVKKVVHFIFNCCGNVSD